MTLLKTNYITVLLLFYCTSATTNKRISDKDESTFCQPTDVVADPVRTG